MPQCSAQGQFQVFGGKPGARPLISLSRGTGCFGDFDAFFCGSLTAASLAAVFTGAFFAAAFLAAHRFFKAATSGAWHAVNPVAYPRSFV